MEKILLVLQVLSIKKICFLDQGVGPSVAEKFRLLNGQLDKTKFVEVDIENADYLIFSPFTPDHHVAGSDTIKILISGENMCPDFNACDYAISGENLTLGDRHLRVPIYAMDPATEGLIKREKVTKVEIANRSRFCSFVYSNSGLADPYREAFFLALNDAKPVSSAGRILRNDDSLESITGSEDWGLEKRNYILDFRFNIAIENAQHPGYITEKITDAFLAGCIPIYWGDPNICNEFNRNAFVNLRDFNSLDKAVDYILAIDEDENKALEMMNAPVFAGTKDLVAKYINSSRAFSDRIFSQPLPQARRRPRHGWVQGMEIYRRKDQNGFRRRLKRNRY